MLAAPRIAIDLPLKILVWEDGQEKVWVSYNSPEYLKERHGLPQELLRDIAVVEYYQFTNGHFHDDSSHPTSPGMCTTTSSSQCLSSTSGYANANGVFSIRLFPTLTGQAEAVILSCTNDGVYWASRTDNYGVGYHDSVYNDDPNVWLKIGGDDTVGGTGHGRTAYNRYMQNTPSWQILGATQNYLNAHPEFNPPKCA